DALEQLRRALAQAIERIAAACPAAMPTTVAERLKAVQDRIWAMHDALLTIRLPFETFYNSLTDELRQRLLAVVILAIMSWQGLLAAIASYPFHDVTAALALPRIWHWLALLIGVIGAALSALAMALRREDRL